jgi:hypothetical protein
MKRLLPAFCLCAFAGCHFEDTMSDPREFNRPAAENDRWSSGHKTVWDEKNEKRGFIEVQRCVVEGSKVTHEDWFVKDLDYNLLGYVTEYGQTYRFKRGSADAVHIGNYTMQDAVRVLLQIRTNFEIRGTKIED